MWQRRYGKILALSFAGALVRIKRFVRALQQLRGCFPGLVIRPSAGKSALNLVSVIFKLMAFDPRKDVPDFLHGAFRQQHHELVATQPNRQIRPTNGALQALGKALQSLVPRRMPQLIVDLLEAVDVNQQQG